MIRKVASIARTMLGLDIARRGLYVYPDDTFIVSYPRSGNTWTRFLVANLLHSAHPVTFENIEQFVPDMHGQSKRFFRNLPRPRVIKSHEYFDPRYRRVIYIVRDPRDVVLSSYNFHRKQRQIEDDCPLERYVTRFLTGDVFSIYASWGENVSSWLSTRPVNETPRGLFGSWGDNVSSWLSPPKNGVDFLLLRYESMVENPECELAKIAAFFGITATPDLLSQAVARSSADAMRKLEKSQAGNWLLTKNTRQDIPFVGAAKAGGWRSGLPPESVAEIESAWGHLMRVLGYDLVSAVPSAR